MLDVGWSELLVIGVVALIVIGPKDLPVMFQALGRFTAKARSMAREFSRAMEDAAKTSGVNDVAKDLKGMTSAKSLGLDKVQQAVGKFEAWDPLKKSAPTVKGTPPAPSPVTPAATASATSPAATPSAAASSAAAPSAAAPVAAGTAVAAPANAAGAGTAAAAGPALAEPAASAEPATPAGQASATPAGQPLFDPLAGT